jgi:hypothetical protein
MTCGMIDGISLCPMPHRTIGHWNLSLKGSAGNARTSVEDYLKIRLLVGTTLSGCVRLSPGIAQAPWNLQEVHATPYRQSESIGEYFGQN